MNAQGDRVFFRTQPQYEAGRVVFQIGTPDAVGALKAALLKCTSLVSHNPFVNRLSLMLIHCYHISVQLHPPSTDDCI